MARGGSPIVSAVTPAVGKASSTIEALRVRMNPVARRLTLLLILLFVVILVGFGVERLLSLQSNHPFGHTSTGHRVGWAGLAVIALVFVYPIRKRYGRRPRWSKRWFQVHMVAGVLGPSLIVVHAGSHFHALVPVLALIAMVLVVVSGVIGQGVHYLAVRRLYERRHELADLKMDSHAIEAALHGLAVQEEGFRLWQTIHAPLTLLFVVLTVVHVVGALYLSGW